MSVLSHRVLISITYIAKYKLNKKSVTRETITQLQVVLIILAIWYDLIDLIYKCGYIT